ncbi:hypothetical protein [Acidisphaera sp. L21]|uniref:hypothetical protein n=1 Tax=Acidisphaera sp. L21 TaxID=1641851 RepID=UPI00131D1DCD|nr:hypothetical protein [Acidisphaera sp. L21]
MGTSVAQGAAFSLVLLWSWAADAQSTCTALGSNDPSSTELKAVQIPGLRPETQKRSEYDSQVRHAFWRAERAIRASQNFPGPACGRETVQRELQEAKLELQQVPPDPLDAASRNNQKDQWEQLKSAAKQILMNMLQGKPPVTVDQGIKLFGELTASTVGGEGTDLSKAFLLAAIDGEAARDAMVPDWAIDTERQEYERIVEIRHRKYEETAAYAAVVAQWSRDRNERARLLQGMTVFEQSLTTFMSSTASPLRQDVAPPPIPYRIDIQQTPLPTGPSLASPPQKPATQGPVELNLPP